jgi:4-carboxymuconolactone decarboxylase
MVSPFGRFIDEEDDGMTRIPHPDEQDLSPAARQLLSQFPPLNVNRMFAGAPAALAPLTDLGQAILLHAQLDPRLREIAILAVARTSRSRYEGAQRQNTCRLIGMPDDEIGAAAGGDVDQLDADARLVWRFGEQIARDVQADERLTEEVLQRLGRRQATELVVACAYYSAVARIIETCGVETEERLPTADIDPSDWQRAST